MRTTTGLRILLTVVFSGAATPGFGHPLPRIDPRQAGFEPDRIERLHRFAQKFVDWRTYGERPAGSHYDQTTSSPSPR